MREQAVRRFRRTTRRLAAQFIAGKISRDSYLSGVRSAAVDAELLARSGKRRSRADKILDVLAWSSRPLPPGELPAALEPYFERFESGTIEFSALRAHVTDLLAQASRPLLPG
jgi:hypothetical protein